MSRVPRILAALLVVVGGVVHFELWRTGYRGIPYVGPMFLANVVASGLIAVSLLVVKDLRVAIAGVALSVGSLIGLVLSRTVGLAGFMESGFTVAASRTVAAEVGALVALALVVVTTRQARAVASLAPAPATTSS